MEFQFSPRSIPFDQFRYVYPPRIENALPLVDLGKYDDETFIAQPKLNGDCVVVFTNGIEFQIWDRSAKPYGKSAKLKFDPNLLHRGKPGSWFAVAGEFMAKGQSDSKGKDTNGQFIIFDAIVFDGMHLTGTTFEARRILLDRLFGIENGPEAFLHSTNIPDVHRVRTYETKFLEIWNSVVDVQMVEGMVLKLKTGILSNGSQNASQYSLKFRKSTPNYQY